MRVFAVSGYSGTGKTTLVEAIVRSLVKRGHSVATIKSSKHNAGPEQGTDTWRHKEAGASLTIFLRPDSTGSLTDRLKQDEKAELSKYDYLIVEGMKSANIPKFWCVGEMDVHQEDIPLSTEAIVSWSDKIRYTSLELPVYLADEIDRLVEVVISRAVDMSEIV